MRHNKLLDNYSNYDLLSYDEANDLLSCKISPDIYSEINDTNLMRILNINTIDYVITSLQKRTIHTAKILGKEVNMKTDKLNMVFTLSELGIGRDISGNYISMAREKIFLYLQTQKGKKKMEKLLSNLVFVFKHSGNYKNTLVITHGFILKYIYLFLYLKQKRESLSMEDFSSINFNYMDGFFITKGQIQDFLSQ